MTAEAFVTEAGVVVPALSTEQMREVDRLAVEELGPNLFQMMENAGRGLAVTVLDLLGSDWRSTPIAVLAGTGGNGGGGICAARHLANHGADVTLVVSDVERLTPVPAAQLAIYQSTPGRRVDVSELDVLEAGVIVDAVIGYSLADAPRGVPLRLIEWIGTGRAPVISLDVPSGIDSTTGEAQGAHVRATTTLTLALPKRGLDAEGVGDLWLADLGIPAAVYTRIGVEVPPELFGSRFRVRLRAQSVLEREKGTDDDG